MTENETVVSVDAISEGNFLLYLSLYTPKECLPLIMLVHNKIKRSDVVVCGTLRQRPVRINLSESVQWLIKSFPSKVKDLIGQFTMASS